MKTNLHRAAYQCDPAAFRIDLFGGDRLDRETAITTALDIIAIASLFGGLSEEQRARLERIPAAPAVRDCIERHKLAAS